MDPCYIIDIINLLTHKTPDTFLWMWAINEISEIFLVSEVCKSSRPFGSPSCQKFDWSPPPAFRQKVLT